MSESLASEPRDHQIQTQAGRLFAREWRPAEEQGEPIVLLHDSLGCVELWRDFPSELSASAARRVIAYDRLGFGQSDPFVGRLPRDFITRECEQSLPPLLKALDVDRFVLFGHSVGGGMGVAGAATFGARCVALITESSQIFWEDKIPEEIRAAQTALLPGSPQYERLAKYHGDKTDWVLSAWIDTWLDPTFVLELTPSIKALRCPVLAFHGDRDEYCSTAQAKRLCDLAPGPAQLHVMHDCGHFPHRERPAEVLDAVARFLAQHSPSQGEER